MNTVALLVMTVTMTGAAIAIASVILIYFPSPIAIPLVGIISSILAPTISATVVALIVNPIKARQSEIKKQLVEIHAAVNSTAKNMAKDLANIRSQNERLRIEAAKNGKDDPPPSTPPPQYTHNSEGEDVG